MVRNGLIQSSDNGFLQVRDVVVDYRAIMEMLVRPGTFTAVNGEAVGLQTVVGGDGVEVDLLLLSIFLLLPPIHI